MANRFDMKDLRASIARVASITGKGKPEVVQTAARGFVKTIVAITPPASKGSSGTAAKKAGEAAITADTALSLEPMSERQLHELQEFHGDNVYTATELRDKKGRVYLEDKNHIVWSVAAALAFHLNKRNRSTGRVMANAKALRNGTRMRSRDAGAHNGHLGRSRSDDIALVPRSVLDGVRKILFKQVGILAAGWIRAAEKLNVRLPSWIARHAFAAGACRIMQTATMFRIEVENAVPYVGNVKGYEKRVISAVALQARAMDRQADYLMRKAIKAAGF